MNEQLANILLIEDNPDDAELLQRMLHTQGLPTTVEWVQSLAEGVEAIQQVRFDIIVTDLGLPDSAGLETLIALRKTTDSIPVIALTGSGDDELGLAAIRAGANDFVPKNKVNGLMFSRAIAYTIQRYQMTSKLKEANRQLAGKNERLAKMYKMSQQFVDNVSHEFRTPLTVIREFAAIIRDGIDGPVTDEQAGRLSTLINRADELARMVDDLLDTSRLESGLVKICRGDYRLADIIEEVRQMLAQKARTKQITLKVQEIPADLQVFCDDDKFKQILINLVANAVKFTPLQGQIEISTRVSDHHAIISVVDNGPGIPRQDLEKIFERFQQAEVHNRMASCKGFGLGLSIARALAHLNLGALEVDSVEGEGSRFSVRVPLANPDSILACYLDQRIQSGDGSGKVSVFNVLPGDFAPADRQEVLDTVDEFLRTSVKNFDLVLQRREGRWLVYMWNVENSLEEIYGRLTRRWTKEARNHYGVLLPALHFETEVTRCLPEGRRALETLTRQWEPASASPQPTPPAGAASRENKRILVVDDELEVAGAVEARLKSNGYDVTTVHDGQSGLEAVAETRPDAILLDIRMPELDGLTVLKRLKANPETAATPVIVLSASLQDQQQALDRGAAFFIRKPFKSEAIFAAITTSLNQTETLLSSGAGDP